MCVKSKWPFFLSKSYWILKRTIFLVFNGVTKFFNRSYSFLTLLQIWHSVIAIGFTFIKTVICMTSKKWWIAFSSLSTSTYSVTNDVRKSRPLFRHFISYCVFYWKLGRQQQQQQNELYEIFFGENKSHLIQVLSKLKKPSFQFII